jgi:hypothetical protein
VPSTATGGTAAVNWYFASSVPSEVIGPILKMADEQKWTAEQVAAAIKSASGAPTTVTITTTGTSASGGDASSIPAGTGDSSTVRAHDGDSSGRPSARRLAILIDLAPGITGRPDNAASGGASVAPVHLTVNVAAAAWTRASGS